MARPAIFKEADLTRALKSAAKAGLPVAKFTVSKDGTLTIYTGGNTDTSDPNPWDQ